MRSRPIAAAARLLALLLFAGQLGFTGCASSRSAESVVDQKSDAASELDFWQALEKSPLLSNHDALHGLLLLADGRDERASFAGRMEEAHARGWIDPDDTLVANEAATIGWVSVAVCEMLDLEGGATLSTFGRSQRYCTRELVFEEILPERSPRQAVRGIEFLDLAGRVEDWRERHAGAGAKP